MQDNDHSEEEIAQAEALAQALEGDGSHGELPLEALSMAALLQYARDGGALPDHLEAEILAELSPLVVEAQKRRKLWLLERWIWIPAGGMATALLTLFLVMMVRSGPSPDPTVLPRPSAQLLGVQTSVASGDPLALNELASSMQDYRDQWYWALNERYTGY